MMLNKRNWWNVGVVAALALVALFAVAPAGAQEQVGTIQGSVSDASGAVLPGATVEAVSAGGTRLSGTTNESGSYRFPRVPPGTYVVVAKLDGFNPAEVQNVSVRLGDTATANLTLEVGAVSETISVIGEAGQIDIKSSATSASITGEDIAMLPKGRDFTTIATMAPGVTQEGFAGGLSIDGASGSENRFVIDGVDTTDAFDGTSGQNLITEFVEEVQVKSAGYPAEFGGSVGGVINAVTKSGTNEFKGWVGVYYNDRDWDGAERQTPYDTGTSLYRTFEEDDITRTEPGFGIGGPIAKDMAWFYGGYTYTEVETNRTPPGQTTKTQTDKSEYYLLNIKGNVGSSFLYKVSGNWAPRELDNTLPARDGSTPESVNLDVNSEFPTFSYSGYADWIPNDNFYLSGRLGFYSTDTTVTADFAPYRIFFRDRPFPIQGDPRFRPASFASVPAAAVNGTEFDLFEREAASLDGNFFFDAAGSHALKAGVQYEKVSNEVASGEVANLYTIRWGLPARFAPVIGTYGSLGVRRFGTFGGAASKNLGIYIQDSWSVLPNLTLNIGVRTEEEEVPNYGAAANGIENAWEFGFNDKIAPRLGFAWDVMSDQKLKVYGSWGYYYDISKLNIRGSFGGDKWIEYMYPLNTLDWETIPAQGNCTNSTNVSSINPCPGFGTPVTSDLRFPADPSDPLFGVDPDIKPFQQEEYQLGADYQLTTTSTVSARYVNKSVMHAIEDMGFFYCFSETECVEGYNIGNPGEGVGGIDPTGPVPAQPKAKRDYQAIELSWNRRFADHWSARVGYTYSELTGNYPGLASSDEFGRTSPNTNRLFDYVHNSFDMNGNAVYGDLNTDRPHQIDAQFIYEFGWGTSVGLNQYYGSGTPVSTQVSYNAVPFFAYGRGDAGRTEALTRTDLLISHPFKIGNYGLELSVNVLNLFDEEAVLLVDPNLSNGDLCGPQDPACDGSQDYFFGNTPMNPASIPADEANPYYKKANATGSTADPYQTRRTIRLGLKFTF